MSEGPTSATPVVFSPPAVAVSDQARLETLLQDHFRFVWRAVRRLGVPSEGVDDATQQVFIIASNKLSEILPGKERSFLMGTAVRVAANARRAKASRREEPLDDPIDAPDSRPDPEALLERKRMRMLLDEVLDGLGLELRTVFVLFEFEGLSTPEIAALMEIPLGTAASRLRRARDQFAAHVERLRAQHARRGGLS